MEKQTKTCPLCSSHCSEDALNCDKGHSYFKNKNNSSTNNHFHNFGRFGGRSSQDRHHGTKDDFFDDRITKGSLLDYFMRCSRYIFHSLHDSQFDESKVFAGLSETEQASLKQLLGKMSDSWRGKNPHQL